MKTHDITQVMDAFSKSEVSGLTPVFLDLTYCSRTRSEWRRTLRRLNISKFEWTSDSFDCDNFAVGFCSEMNRRLKINGVGIVVDISNRHAYNVILSRSRRGLELMTVEPQNGKMEVSMRQTPSQGFVIFL